MNTNKSEREAYREYKKSMTDKGETPISAEEWKEEQEKVEKEAKEEQEKVAKHKPSGESKHERFVRLVEKRVNKALAAVRSLEHLHSPAYDSSIEDRKLVIDALRKGLSELEVKYLAQKLKPRFTLSQPEQPEQPEQ